MALLIAEDRFVTCMEYFWDFGLLSMNLLSLVLLSSCCMFFCCYAASLAGFLLGSCRVPAVCFFAATTQVLLVSCLYHRQQMLRANLSRASRLGCL